MMLRRGISTTALVGIMVVLIIIVGVGAYFAGYNAAAGAPQTTTVTTTVVSTVTQTVTQTVTATATVSPSPTPPPTTTTPPTPTTTPPAVGKKVAILFDVGGRGDLSFNDMAWLGAENARKDFGVEVDYITPKSLADMVPLLESLSKKGEYAVLVLVGFLWTQPLEEVAPKYPQQKFALIDAATSKDYPNVANFVFREQEIASLIGVLASDIAYHLGTNKIGAVAGMDIPPLWKFHIGYLFGAKYYEKKTGRSIEFVWIYTGTFTDPAKGKETALQMIQQDVRVIYGLAGATHLGAFEAVKEMSEKGVLSFAIGQDASQEWIDPHHIFLSGMKRVDVAVYTAIKMAISGEFKGGTYSLGIKEGGHDIADLDTVRWFAELAAETGRLKDMTPDDVVNIVKSMREKYISEEAWSIVEELKQKIINGEIKFKFPKTHEEYEQIINELMKGNLDAALEK